MKKVSELEYTRLPIEDFGKEAAAIIEQVALPQGVEEQGEVIPLVFRSFEAGESHVPGQYHRGQSRRIRWSASIPR